MAQIVAEESLTNISGITFEGEITPEEASIFFWPELVFCAFVAIGILADIAIIHTIFRYKRMQNVSNLLIGNWAIADLCSLLVTPSGYRIITILDHIALPYEISCIFYELGAVLHFLEIFFVIVVSLDWFFVVYFPRISSTIRRNYKYVIGGLWSIGLVYAITEIVLCFLSYPLYFTEFVILIAGLTCGIIVVLLQLSRIVQKCRNKPIDESCITLNLATGFVSSYVLSFLIILFEVLLRYHGIALMFIAISLIFSSAMINFVLLYNWHKNFQSCFLQTLRRSNTGYEDSISDLDINTDVHISFHNPTEELLSNAY